MKELIDSFPDQLREALQITRSYFPKVLSREINHVLVAGVGGSGIGANFVGDTKGEELKVPMIINKGYDIPSWVGSDTLFVASSFSGNTEETLSCLKQAIGKRAQCVCITAGGELMTLAQKNGLSLLMLPHHNGIPRANLGYSIVALLSVLNRYGLISGRYENEMADWAVQVESEAAQMRQKARELASKLHGHLPIVYANVHLFGVAKRFQQQVNENAKQFCHVNVFPEMNHNELVGWENPAEILSNSSVVFLKSKFDPKRVTLRWKLLKPVFSKQARFITEIEGIGETRLQEALYFLHLLDYASLYLAEENGADPVAILKIDELKGKLARSV